MKIITTCSKNHQQIFENSEETVYLSRVLTTVTGGGGVGEWLHHRGARPGPVPGPSQRAAVRAPDENPEVSNNRNHWGRGKGGVSADGGGYCGKHP